MKYKKSELLRNAIESVIKSYEADTIQFEALALLFNEYETARFCEQREEEQK